MKDIRGQDGVATQLEVVGSSGSQRTPGWNQGQDTWATSHEADNDEGNMCVLGALPQRPFKEGGWRNGTKKDFDFWSTERECFRLSCYLWASWSATTNNTPSPTISKNEEPEVRRSYL